MYDRMILREDKAMKTLSYIMKMEWGSQYPASVLQNFGPWAFIRICSNNNQTTALNDYVHVHVVKAMYFCMLPYQWSVLYFQTPMHVYSLEQLRARLLHFPKAPRSFAPLWFSSP